MTDAPNGDRPVAHLTPRAGWMNDPLALTWHGGEYHLFFQFVPGRTSWAPNCHWGHATSPDLVHWTEQEVALAPGDGDDGVWSGSIAQGSDGTAVLFYTSVLEPDIGVGRIRSATPDDGAWTHWTKGPVVVEPANDEAVVACRDPFVYQDGDRWRMLVGAALPGGTAAAMSYSSHDLASWTYEGLLAERPSDLTEPAWTGTLWECPQLFELDGSHVLVTSVWEDDVLHHVAYGVGTYSEGRFTARNWGRLTYGSGYYAPSFFRDRDGTPSLIFWIRGVGDHTSPAWESALSVPHVLQLDGDVLLATPHPALAEAWTPSQELHRDARAAVDATALVSWRAEVGSELSLLQSDRRHVRLRRTPADLEVHGDGPVERIPISGDVVTVVIDGPVLEVSTNEALLATDIAPIDSIELHGGWAAVRRPRTVEAAAVDVDPLQAPA